MSIFQKEFECMSRDELTKLQSKRLVNQVKRMYETVKVFKERMDELNLKPSDIKGIEDLSKLPFSYKQDLRDNYPYGLFATPMTDVVRVHASSGTTGKQIVVGYTQADLDMWSDCVARQFAAVGCNEDDFVQISYGYGLFTGGLGAHDGATKIGATVIPTSTGNTARQIQTMVDFGSTVICCTPSYALYLAEELEETGKIGDLKLKAGIFGAEPWTEEMRKAIESKLHIKAFDIYGLSEILGPGVGYECEAQTGMHINEDHFLIEIIDPDTGAVLPDGVNGEVVFTTITKEAFPLIRYRTRDIASITHEKCSCGRTFVKMSKPCGRTDDMLIIRGVNVFPSQIEEILLKVSTSGLTPNYMIVVDRINNTDTFEVQVEMTNELFVSDDLRSIEALKQKIRSDIRGCLGLDCSILLVNPNTIARSEGKAKRVIDKRKLV